MERLVIEGSWVMSRGFKSLHQHPRKDIKIDMTKSCWEVF